MNPLSLNNSRAWRWPSSARKARAHATLVAVVLWVVLLVTFAGGSTRSLAGTIKGADFLQFYTMGSLVRTGQAGMLSDPESFHRAQVLLVPESETERYPPVYPPHTALLFAPFAGLSFLHALWLWSMLTVVAFAAILHGAWRPVAAIVPDRWFVFAAVAAFPPFWSLVLFGQVSVLILAAFWLAAVALDHRRPVLAGIALGLLSIKPQFAAPIAVVLVVCREWRICSGMALSVVLQAVLGTVLLGSSVFVEYGAFIPVMLQYADALEPKPYQSHSIRSLARLFPAWIGLPMWAVATVVVLVYSIRTWKSSAPVRVRIGVVMLASVLVNPHLIVYDAAILAVPLLWLGAHVQERGSPADGRRFWMLTYWLCVAFLLPTAAAVGVQVSVLLMSALLFVITRVVLSDRHARQP